LFIKILIIIVEILSSRNSVLTKPFSDNSE